MKCLVYICNGLSTISFSKVSELYIGWGIGEPAVGAKHIVTQRRLHQQEYKTYSVHDQNAYSLPEFVNNEKRHFIAISFNLSNSGRRFWTKEEEPSIRGTTKKAGLSGYMQEKEILSCRGHSIY